MRPAATILHDASLHHTHWGRVIIHAERRGEFTPGEVAHASSWVTCACGKLDKDIPRWGGEGADGYNARPKDMALVNLGELFYQAVTTDRAEAAARLLCNIERRAVSVVLETVLKASGIPQLQTNQGESNRL